MSSPETGSWAELLRGRNGLRSLALAGGVALHATNIFIVTTILPTVVRDIGGLEYYAWNTTLFVVASILGSAVSSAVIDRLGLRTTFLLAMAVFAWGTVMCALAGVMPVLLAGRTVQGFGGGMLLSMSYSSVRAVFAPALWSRAMVLISSMWGVSTLSGPAVGGIFAELGQWRLAFWSVLPAVAGLALIVFTQVAPGRLASAAKHRVPLGRIGTLALSVLVVSVASLSPWVWVQLAGVIAGGLLAVLMARFDSASSAPLFPTGSYSLRQPLGRLYAAICLLSLGVTSEVYVPYFLQALHGLSPLMAGYWAALMSAGWTLGAFVSSGRSPAMVERLLRIGPLVSAFALAALAVLIPGFVPGLGANWIVPALVGVGFGIGLCWPNLLTRVFTSAPKGQENTASAAITTVQLYAMAMGAAMAGLLTNAAGMANPGGPEGARQAAWVLFLVFALAPGLAVLTNKKS